MQGRILRFSVRDGGIISGDDGQRYSFEGSAWNETGTPAAGQRVDFDAQNGQALDIVLVPSTTATSSKSKIVAFLLAFLLGGFGAHKFYLGHVGLGILYIVLTLTLIGILFTGPAALIESIIYVTKSDEDFERIYVQERKAWF